MFKSMHREFKTIALMAALLAASGAQADSPDATRVAKCFGTEPFWSLTLDGKTIKFKNLGTETSMSINQNTPKAAHGRRAEYLAMYQGRTLESPSRFLNVIIRNQECSDGMSDETYPYSVLVLSGTDLFDGCCR